LIKHWIAVAALCAVLPSAAFAESKHCDRACMTALTDQYLAALVKHDPAGLPLSKGVHFTENTAEIRIGDGLWVGASEAPTTFKIYAVDPASNQVGFYITPRAALLADVPSAERTSREDMINAANSYFEAIEHGDGGIAPFAEDCERHENGGQTTHNATPVPWPVPMGSPEADHAMAILGMLTCTAQVNSQILSFITRLWPRRLGLVDEQKGLVYAFPMFQHRGAVRTIKIKGVPGVDTIQMNGATSNLQAGVNLQNPQRQNPRN